MNTKIWRTRSKIISAAKQLFKDISVYKASMNDIANAAKMSRRTLYMHFKSKDEIYQLVVDSQVNDINNRLEAITKSTLSPDRKLKLYIYARFNVVDKIVRGNRYIRYDFIFNRLRVEQLRKNIDRKEVDLLTQITSAGKELDYFNISNPKDFSKTLLTMFKSLEQPFVLIGDRRRNSQTLVEYVNLLFNGILNHKSNTL